MKKQKCGQCFYYEDCIEAGEDNRKRTNACDDFEPAKAYDPQTASSTREPAAGGSYWVLPALAQQVPPTSRACHPSTQKAPLSA